MTPRCVNCIHWDEEKPGDESGRGFCAELSGGNVQFLPTVMTHGKYVGCQVGVYMLTSGDFGRVRFSPRQVATVRTSRPL